MTEVSKGAIRSMRWYYAHRDERRDYENAARRRRYKTRCKNDPSFKKNKLEWERGYIKRIKLTVYDHYSTNRVCVRCGCDDMRALSIDHIHGAGMRHRAEVGSGVMYYRWFVNNHFPVGFQVLCMNCQFIKRVENNEIYRPGGKR